MTDAPDNVGRSASPAAAGSLLRATLEIDGATLTLLPRRAPVGNSGPIRGRPLTVFPLGVDGSLDGTGGADGDPDGTGGADGNPDGSSGTSGTGDVARLARLRAALPWPDVALLPAVLQPGDAVGVAVFDLSPDEAVAAARALVLPRVLHWDGRRAHLLP